MKKKYRIIAGVIWFSLFMTCQEMKCYIASMLLMVLWVVIAFTVFQNKPPEQPKKKLNN